MKLKASTLRRGINLWPPFLFAGIRVTRRDAVILVEELFSLEGSP